MHGDPVIPHDEVVLPPDVGVDELALCRVFGEVAQERARFGHGPTFDGARMAREIERQAAGRGMSPHQPLADGRPFLALRVGEIRKAKHVA